MWSLYHDTGSIPTDVERFLSLARLSGTLCLRSYRIQSVLWTVADSAEDIFIFTLHSTSVFSLLEISYENALYKFTFDFDFDFG